MKEQEEQFKLPIEYLTCKLCESIFVKPVTLVCGHTFCKICLCENRVKFDKQEKKQKQKQKNRLKKCFVCHNIIWKSPHKFKQNLVIQNLVEKYFGNQDKKNDEKLSSIINQDFDSQSPNQICNKIILKVKMPQIIPMPFTYFDVVFSTVFIDDVISQSNQLVITWEEAFNNGIGLLCKLIKVQPIDTSSTRSRIVIDENFSREGLVHRYKGRFLGNRFIKILSVEEVQINLRNKLIVLNGDSVKQIIEKLQVCHGEALVSYPELQTDAFDIFFRLYDMTMNNHHYIRQINDIISDFPFQRRQKSEDILYCMLRVLKIPHNIRNELALSFNNLTRLQYINNWIIANQDMPFDDILMISIPGKYNNFAVIGTLLVLLAFTLLKDKFLI